MKKRFYLTKVDDLIFECSQAVLKKMSINADWEAIEVSNDEDLVNSISMGCPFDENEKQALLEAINLDKRIEILTSLMNMSVNENTMTKSGTALS